ncbi:hypothetical protein DVR12_12070 [Chitinophaga silvatica]|uniref:Uncharacterized protein n=1 Tax=Chitinophaga silvatica TaxID=2282649 RepID=A0A3E1Y9Y0_9BACT|nr:hypothetical protein [Chitinophaga silvatica]RFS22533.1 hypothetical protein DVR12_12070 [Chitinophaga silvatica]
MEMTTLSEELHQLASWKEEVNEVRNEVKLMRERLEQIVLSDAPKEVMAKVEHFENRLLRQREVADEMFHDLKQCAKKLSDKPVTIVHHDPPIANFQAMQRRMDTFQQLYMELKSDFNRFMPGDESL